MQQTKEKRPLEEDLSKYSKTERALMLEVEDTFCNPLLKGDVDSIKYIIKHLVIGVYRQGKKEAIDKYREKILGLSSIKWGTSEYVDLNEVLSLLSKEK